MPSREELISAIQAELAKRQAAPQMSKEDVAAKMRQEDQPLESGPWYMDLAKDVLNPVDAAAGLATGGMKAAGQGLRSAGKAVLGGTLGKAGEKQAVIDLVNEGSGLAPKAKELITQAAQNIAEKGIKPKEDALRALLQGKSGQVNPDTVAKVFPNYAAKLAEKRAPQTVIGPLGEEVVTAGSSGPVEVPLSRMLRLKRGADKAAGYSKNQALFNEAAASKNAEARAVGDIARNQIYENAPGSEQILSDMGKDIKLKNFLTKKAESDPVGLLKSKAGTTKDSVLAAADKAAGTDLRGYGDMIESAVDLQMNPKHLVNPLGFAPELRKMATRAAIKSGSVANSAAEGAGKVLGAVKAPEALGYAGAREITDGILPSERGAPAAETSPSRDELIQKIQAEIARRQAP